MDVNEQIPAMGRTDCGTDEPITSSKAQATASWMAWENDQNFTPWNFKAHWRKITKSNLSNYEDLWQFHVWYCTILLGRLRCQYNISRSRRWVDRKGRTLKMTSFGTYWYWYQENDGTNSRQSRLGLTAQQFDPTFRNRVGKSSNGRPCPLGRETGGGVIQLARHPLDTVFQIKVENCVNLLETGVHMKVEYSVFFFGRQCAFGWTMTAK